MALRHTLATLIVAAFTSVPAAHAVVSVQAFYRLGDADPGAAPGNLGDNPTVDSGPGGIDLARHGTPHYSADVPFNSPTAVGDHLSMFFNNNPAVVGPGPLADDGYTHATQVPLPSINWGIEAWVKPAVGDFTSGNGYSLIAYNGRYFSDPSYGLASGIGLFQHGSNYVARIGFHEKILAPVVPGKWTHLAFMRQSALNRFFVDGAEEFDATADAQTTPLFTTDGLPGAAPGYLAIGSFPTGLLSPLTATAAGSYTNSFWGNIDDVRFFTYSLIGPTALDPAADLLYVVPEPGTILLLSVSLAPLTLRRRRR
jgi:hypothetical protein